MPSTLVHVAVGALIAAGLLGREFDARSLAVALGAAALPDLDTFLGLWIRGGHRALLHTLLLPAALGVALYYDLRVRDRSWLRARYGDRGVRVAATGIAALALAGIGPDLFTNGVNVFYPVRDQFYVIQGEAVVSNQRGFVQTFVELRPPASGSDTTIVGETAGSTDETQYRTGVDPQPADPGADAGPVERVFPLVRSGTQLLLVIAGAFVAGARLWETRR